MLALEGVKMKRVKVLLGCLVAALLSSCATIGPASLRAPSGTPSIDLSAASVEFELEIEGDPHPLLAIRGLAVDPQGNLYVVDCDGNRIQKFDGQGNFLTTLGSEGTEDGQFSLWIDTDWPGGGVASDAQGNVYVVDAGNSRIQVFDSDGEFLAKWGELGMGDGQFFMPVGVAVGPQGDVYVTDVTRRDVQRFGSEGQFLAKWSVPDIMEYWEVVAPAVDARGNVYVPVPEAKEIHKFDSEGKLLARIGEAGTGDGQFGLPVAVATDSQGNVYVADESLHRVQVFDPEGNFLRSWGTMGTDQGEFRAPSGLAVAGDGSVYVADGNSRVQKFRQR